MILLFDAVNAPIICSEESATLKKTSDDLRDFVSPLGESHLERKHLGETRTSVDVFSITCIIQYSPDNMDARSVSVTRSNSRLSSHVLANLRDLNPRLLEAIRAYPVATKTDRSTR